MLSQGARSPAALHRLLLLPSSARIALKRRQSPLILPIARLASSSSSSSSPSTAGNTSSSSGSSSSSPLPPNSAAARQRQTRREWVVVYASGALATAGVAWYWLHSSRNSPSSSSSSSVSALAQQEQQSRAFSLLHRPVTFSIPVRTPTGVQPKIISSLSPAQVDAVLRAAERTVLVDRPQGSCVVKRYDTNSLPSNDPIEDRRAEAIVERERGIFGTANLGVAAPPAAAAAAGVKGDLSFFAVMDGHAGWQTSQLLSQKLIASVALELDRVFREKGEYAEIARAKASMPTKMWRSLFGAPSSEADASGATTTTATTTTATASTSQGLDGDPELIKRAITKAFLALDREICKGPVDMLKEYELGLAAIASGSSGADLKASGSGSSSGPGSLFGLTSALWPKGSTTVVSQPPAATGANAVSPLSAYEALLPALSGSCALLTYIDSARRDLYVACTGDSRAVAGYWNHREERWEVEALSVDQTGRNESEAKRMRSEHPADEKDHVIMRGRVLGGLEPTRAFGDARYKWDRGLQERLYDAFVPGGKQAVRAPPRLLKTPPYVTARPEVEWRKIPGPGQGERELRFLVMATDGLWDMLSNEQVVGLVAGHLSGQKGPLRGSEMHARFLEGSKVGQEDPKVGAIVEASSNSEDAKGPNRDHDSHPLNRSREPTFVFDDSNLSTHLVRNALGGGNRDRVAGLLAIPAPHSRRYRDDITVNVIVFHSAAELAASQQQAPTNAAAPEPTSIRSKL